MAHLAQYTKSIPYKARENDLREQIPHTWPSFHENYFQSILGSVSYCTVILRTPPYWWNFPRVKKLAKCKYHLLHVSFFLILTLALEHVFCLGKSGSSQVNNSPRLNVFPAGVANFGKAMYRSLERSTQDTRVGFFLYSAQASFSWPRVDLARLLRRAYSRPFWITSFEFVKVCGIRFSIWESFIGFYICCYPITTILTCLFFVGVRILCKKLCWMRAWRRRCHLVSPTLYIIIVRI